MKPKPFRPNRAPQDLKPGVVYQCEDGLLLMPLGRQWCGLNMILWYVWVDLETRLPTNEGVQHEEFNDDEAHDLTYRLPSPAIHFGRPRGKRKSFWVGRRSNGGVNHE